jgi:ABC-type branched-subunit amino acid transport system substrate-binding protein
MNAENKQSEFGPAAKNLVLIDVWFPEIEVPGLKEWLTGIQKFKPGNPPVGCTVQGYAAMRSLIEAIKAAREVDRDKVLRALATVEFWTPWGQFKYTEDRKTTHQMLRNMVVAQFTDKGEVIVWPAKLAKEKLVYPAKYGPGN